MPADSQHWKFAWRMSIHLTGLPFALISLILVWFGVAFALGDPAYRNPFRFAEIIVPLVGGVQAVFAFAPRDEHALELLLAAPRPPRWLLYERFAVIVILQMVSALLATMVISLLPGGESFVSGIARWLPPLLAVGGAGAYVSTVFGRANFGLLIVILFYGVAALGGEVFVYHWLTAEMTGTYTLFAFLWPLHLFLQPEALGGAAYTFNRLILFGIGLLTFTLTLRLSDKTERMLALARED